MFVFSFICSYLSDYTIILVKDIAREVARNECTLQFSLLSALLCCVMREVSLQVVRNDISNRKKHYLVFEKALLGFFTRVSAFRLSVVFLPMAFLEGCFFLFQHK